MDDFLKLGFQLDCRKANISDSLLLLEWRNLPDVRKYSRDTREISLEEHTTWFSEKTDPSQSGSAIYIFSNNFEPVGMSRLDKISIFEAQISIIVAPEHRRSGVGFFMLQKTILLGVESESLKIFNAYIHLENFASKKLFGKCGFRSTETVENFDKFIFP